MRTFLYNLFYINNLQYQEVKGMAISSVVPPLTLTLKEMAHKYFHLEPLMVGPGIKTGLPPTL